jgi:2,4-dichlorophenol 6-monooxygenase
VALANTDVSARNAMRMLEVYQALGSGGEPLATAIANQAEHFDMLGLQLGFSYAEGALVPDGSAAAVVGSSVREYVPSGRPGGRLPHAWLDGGVGGRSTLDLVPCDAFLLIAGQDGAAWIEAAARVTRVPLACVRIGRDVPDAEGRWAAQLGIAVDGALLVRPDQHVGWRCARAARDPHAALEAALAAILGA